MRQTFILVAVTLATALVGECGQAADRRPDAAAATDNADVVHLDGVRDIRLGQSARDLIRRGALETEEQGCGLRFASLSTANPVFDEDRLVLLWINPPLRTPEGVTVGTPVDKVRTRYPQREELDAPADTYRFDGMLVTRDDRAYLFLHDGATVKKTIVGYSTTYAGSSTKVSASAEPLLTSPWRT